MLVSDDTILRIAGNKKALAALDEETRGDILGLKAEIEARKRNEEEERRRREAEEELDRKRREADRENKRREFLCAGKWGEKVPPERRFALCKRIGKRFEGTCERERKDPSKWVDEEEWCAVDLVRGYKNPYFGYWRYWEDNGIHQIWKENIGPLLGLFRINAVQAAADMISRDWNFFSIDDYEKDWQFWAMDYEVGDDGHVKITGDGKYGLATFEEHQRKLRKEFENDKQGKVWQEVKGVGMIEEISPELFSYELYDSGGIWTLDDAVYVGASFGYCDASRLQVRPKSGEFALMVEWPNGNKCWFHINEEMLECIKRRLARKGDKTR